MATTRTSFATLILNGLAGLEASFGYPVAIKRVGENYPEKPAWTQAMLEGKGGEELGSCLTRGDISAVIQKSLEGQDLFLK